MADCYLSIAIADLFYKLFGCCSYLFLLFFFSHVYLHLRISFLSQETGFQTFAKSFALYEY